MFVIRILVLVLAVLVARASAQCSFEADYTVCYAPLDDILAAGGSAHEVHELTIFLPPIPPPSNGNGLYPTILYSPAGAFAQGSATEGTQPSLGGLYGEQKALQKIGHGPFYIDISAQPFATQPGTEAATGGPPCGFLDEALNRGWAVVTVGTTGHDSWPTCDQGNDCNACKNFTPDPCGALPGDCRDTNLWVDPESADWDDFNVFSGEKEMTWARQWIGEFGGDAPYGLDTTRVVTCGTSTGAIYSSFLAFGPDRAWSAAISEQAKQDTRVAAMVAFEPNIWVKSLRSGSPGVHWASSNDPLDVCGEMTFFCNMGFAEDCYNRRSISTDTTIVGGAAPGLVEASSVSRWVREIDLLLPAEEVEQSTPCFILSGDGGLTTGFSRDANVFTGDYDRHDIVTPLVCGTSFGANPELIAGDPLLEYTFTPELNLHDSWNAINFMIDLLMLDETLGGTFHSTYSRLYLEDTNDWGMLPPCLSTTGSIPALAEEVLYLDGTFPAQPTLNGFVSSIDNTVAAPLIVTWMEAVLDVRRGDGVVSRNPVTVGPMKLTNENLDILTTGTPYDGLPIPVEVDLNGVADYDEAAILIFSQPYPACSEIVLGGGQALLCDLDPEPFATLFVAPDGDGVVRFSLGAASPVGETFCLQAILRDLAPFPGKRAFGLTNAVDLEVQFVP